MELQAWSNFLSDHGPWPALGAVLLAGVAFLLRRLACVQDRAWETLDANTRAIVEFSTLLRERLPK